MQSSTKHLVIAILTAWFCAISTLSGSAENIVTKVVMTDRIPPYKISFDVMLKRRVTAAELAQIARSIKDQAPGYELTFIGYNIAGLTKESGYWGTSHWTGNDVRLVPGMSEAVFQKVKALPGPATPKGSKVLGRWFMPGAYLSHIVIYQHQSKYFVHQRYAKGGGAAVAVKLKTHKRGTAYVEPGGSDYFVVTEDGYLQMWDNRGQLDHDLAVKMQH